MAQEALDNGEVPVGCVFVKGDQAIARARNRTNEWHNVSSTRDKGDDSGGWNMRRGDHMCITWAS